VALDNLRLFPSGAKLANFDKPTGMTGGITRSQRRWEKLAAAFADPFSLVY
jgi:hypothetical protein